MIKRGGRRGAYRSNEGTGNGTSFPLGERTELEPVGRRTEEETADDKEEGQRGICGRQKVFGSTDFSLHCCRVLSLAFFSSRRNYTSMPWQEEVSSLC